MKTKVGNYKRILEQNGEIIHSQRNMLTKYQEIKTGAIFTKINYQNKLGSGKGVGVDSHVYPAELSIVQPEKRRIKVSRKYVVKYIDISSLDKESASVAISELEKEFMMCRKAGHLGVKPLLVKENAIYLIMKRMPGVSMHELMDDTHDKPETKLLNIYFCLLALKYEVIDKDLTHGDIKPENILIDKTGAHFVDFGFAEEKNADGTINQTARGTPAWSAPEMFNLLPTENITSLPIAQSADIFSLGKIIAAYIGQKNRRFAFVYLIDIFLDAQSAENLDTLEFPWLAPLLEKMLDLDPQKRININNLILQYEYLVQNNFPDLKLFNPFVGKGQRDLQNILRKITCYQAGSVYNKCAVFSSSVKFLENLSRIAQIPDEVEFFRRLTLYFEKINGIKNKRPLEVTLCQKLELIIEEYQSHQLPSHHHQFD